MNEQDKIPRNIFRVPWKQWYRWTIVGKHVFNKTFSYMVANQDNFRHREAPTVLEKHFRTTAWNAAFVAADVASRGEKNLLEYLVKEIWDDDVQKVRALRKSSRVP